MSKQCSVDGCCSQLLARGYCKRHYDRWRRHGDPLICKKQLSPRGAPIQWLLAHVNFNENTCLVWPFARHKDGRAHINGDFPSRIMCELAHGAPPSPIHQAAHSCGKGNSGCVNPSHLRWATPAENSADKIIHGTLLMGDALPQSKLSAYDVLAIRALHGSVTQRALAARYGVKPACINKIVQRQSWRHL